MWSSMVDFMNAYPMAWVAFIGAVILCLGGIFCVFVLITTMITDPQARKDFAKDMKGDN